MAIKYKQLCFKCKKNFVITTYKQKYTICYECQKEELNQKIKDSAIKKLFGIPEEYYKENSFLRNIKIAYLRYGELTERQLEAFKKTVKKMKDKKG